MRVWAYRLPCGQRVFHLLPIAILTTAAIAYFSMAWDLGGTPVPAEFFSNRHQNQGPDPRHLRPLTRSHPWPELLLGTGLPLSDIFVTVFMGIAMIVAGLFGAVVPSTHKWGYFAGGMAPLFFIRCILLGPARTSAELIGPDVHIIYLRSGLSDRDNVIHPDDEIIFYGSLDILAKPVFIFIHIVSLRGIDVACFGLTGVGVDGVSAIQGTRTIGFFNEKPGANTPEAAPVNRPVDALPDDVA
ncbi:family A G protein-coupled receptor-like protein [Calocera viscosa TUFC12733]|uniref:Family A G protein-coupled receptor-like protein n=1 Tax=Calocera viscosa (strain TUFC12733) TaxID=1330018 RepID=A0A167J145_CALVF|nr:family A G protein-coupled receptor-like protein [Calocera viscosa TUFC12733]